MLYSYEAVDTKGKKIESEYEAADERQVLQYLATHGLQPISIHLLRRKRGASRGGKITIADKVFLTRYLALMLKVGTDLLAAVNILIEDFEKPAIRSFLVEVRDNLSRGQPFYQAFANYPAIFSPVFINLVKAAEASGNLQQTFDDLSVSLQKEAELRQRIRSAFIYPIILLVLSFLIFIFLSVFALPKIARVFSDSGVNPPLFSKVVFAVGLFVGDNIFVLAAALLLVAGSGFYFFSRTLVGRRFGNQVLRKTPVIRRVFKDIAIQRFASTFAALIKAGIPIVEAIKITSEVVNSEEFRTSLLRIADEGLSKGLTLGEAFRREPAFPVVVANLIAISEKAGHLEEVLLTLSDFYASNIDDSVRTLVAFVEPVLLLGMGLMVATIALSIIVPIYQLTSAF